MATPTKTMMIASALGIASLAFVGGFAVSAATARPLPQDPIVNVNAWNEEPAAMPVQIAADQPAEKCNPWDVSDIAMEEVLREMQRRGWRQPRQGDAVTSLVSLGVEGIDAVDPYASMPSRSRSSGSRSVSSDDGVSIIAVLSDEDAMRVRNDQVSVEQLLAAEVPIPPPS